MWKTLTLMLFCGVLALSCGSQGGHSEDVEKHMATKDHDSDKKHGDHHGHGHDANAHMNKTPFEELVRRFEEEGRSDWQQPEKVVAMMGDLSGKTVADIGVGTGYFAFPLAKAGAKVIGIDIDQRFLDYVAEKKSGMEQVANIELRLSKEDDPLLKKDEADHAIIVNTYHHIHNRENYFGSVREDLKDGGSLWVIDFFKKELPMGPPIEMKMTAETVEKELLAAGYSKITINEKTLPYQYIVVAEK